MTRATLPHFLAALLLAAVATSQDAAERCAEALLRGDTAAAAAAATSAADPALRARLQAALLPPSRRPAAMLGVAAQFPKTPQADLAILAGAAAALVLRDNGRAVPELSAWNDFEDCDEDWGWMPAPVVQGLWRQLEQRRALGGDLAILAEAEQALLRCSVSRYGFQPARVAPQATWTLPERREALRFRAWQRQPGRIGWQDAIPEGPADREVLLNVDDKTPIDALPAGDWLVELASTTTHWRGLRTVEVSDLDVITLADRNQIAIAAWRAGKSVPSSNWWLTRDSEAQGAGITDERATMLFDDALREGGELFVAADGQHARVPLSWTRNKVVAADRWQVHLMVDRPVYKPGERIQGRLLVRETTYEGEGIDAVATPAPAANREISLTVFKDDEEIRIAGVTDAYGVWSFEVAIPETAAQGGARFLVHLAGVEQPILKSTPCEIMEFRRPPLQLDVDGNRKKIAHGTDTSATLRAKWASGAPASGLLVDATVRTWPNHHAIETHKLATDASGLATLHLPLKKLNATWVRIEFRVATPAGPKKLTHTIDCRPTRNAPEQASWKRRYGPRLQVPEVAIVGQPLTIKVRGLANDGVLFVNGRGRRARTRSLQLDEQGDAELTIVPTREQWPALDLVVAGRKHSHQLRMPLLFRSEIRPEIEVPSSTTPGSTVECAIATGVPGTAVTVAVVDERIFTISNDRTPEPDAAMRPTVAAPKWIHTTSAEALTPKQLLGALLENGRVPASDHHGEVGRGPSAPAAGGPAAGGIGRVRTDFRATATFKTVITDANGLAKVDVALPDDLTTWRVSLVGIAGDGMGFQEQRKIVTRVPLAAEPVLPRVLRVGDSVNVPVVVDRKTETGNAKTVQLSANCVNAAATIDNGEHNVAVRGGAAAQAIVTLKGKSAGRSQLALSANVGEFEDRSLRTLPVRPDAVQRPVSAASMALGNVTLAAPNEMSGTAEVTVLGGSSATWAALDKRLSTYPYGCVEQTLARLLPFFAAARGAKVHGTPAPIAGEDFSERLRAGLKRMRQLQAGIGGPFAFWPGGEPDLHMTALVLHGLAAMREGGLEPTRFGLDCDLAREPFATAIKKITQRAGIASTKDQWTQVELASAGLRMHPSAANAHAAVAAAIAAEQVLPSGLLLRAGLALATAGDQKLATVCLQRAAAQHGKASAAPSLPGENALAVRALQLELQCVLQPGNAPAKLASEVLLRCLNGYSTTYAQACALSASALAMPRRDGKAFSVRLKAGTQVRELTLSPDNDFTARVRTKDATTCSVVGPENQQLIVRVAGHRYEAGSTHAAWSNPMIVERDLCRRDEKATEKQRKNKRDLIPIKGDTFAAGQVVWLRLRVHAPQTMRYVVVDCPLPAGFEPMDTPRWLERFDDRIALSCGSVGPRPKQFVVPLIPTLVGNMVWPPTTAEPMYANGQDGGTAGSRLVVTAATATPNRPTQIACFEIIPAPRKAKVVVETARDRVDDAMQDLRDAFRGRRNTDFQTELATTLATARTACDELRGEGNEPDYVLDELTSTIGSWYYDLEHNPAGAPKQTLRTSALHELVALHHECTTQTIEQFERDHSGEYDAHYVETLVEALMLWPGQDVREPMLARVLNLALARDELPRYLLDDIEGPVEDDDLRSVLMTILASHPKKHGEEILELLPREDVRSTAPAVLVQAADGDWPRWLIHLLLDTELGRAELQRCLRTPEIVAQHAHALIAEMPAAAWRPQPLTTFAVLQRQYLDDVDLAAMLATAAVPTEALQRELVHSNDVDWQATLARALQQRGIRDLGGLPLPTSEESFAGFWLRAIAIPAEDAAAALQLHASIYDEVGSEPLCTFLREIILRTGTPQELALIASDLEESELTSLFAHREPAHIRKVLSLCAEQIYPLPHPQSTEDCVAMWNYANRLEDHREVLEAFCHNETALLFAIEQIAAVPDKELRNSLEHDLRSLRELDTETGLPPSDQPWLPLLQSVAHRGVSTTWTAQQRQRYDRIRRLRGVR